LTVRYSAMESRMKPISSSLGCGRIVISALLSARSTPGGQGGMRLLQPRRASFAPHAWLSGAELHAAAASEHSVPWI